MSSIWFWENLMRENFTRSSQLKICENFSMPTFTPAKSRILKFAHMRNIGDFRILGVSQVVRLPGHEGFSIG
jgi:hypothetical protein